MEFVREFVEKLRSGVTLNASDIEECAESFASGDFEVDSASELLELLSRQGYTGTALEGFARVFRAHMAPAPPVSRKFLVDTCGTGGGSASWNLSTAAALIVAGAGGRVAKHGNRAVSSRVGSADVLESLGINLEADPVKSLQSCGIGFFFAPRFHPAFRHVGPLRKALPFRTIFNCLGPLLNPVGATRQVVGVWDRALVQPMSEALRGLGAERGLVVHGENGLDEVSPVGRTWASVTKGGKAPNWLTLERFGLTPVGPEALIPSETPEGNAELVRTAISDDGSLPFQAVLPSAAAAIWAAGLTDELVEAVELARLAVLDRKATLKLQQWIEVTND